MHPADFALPSIHITRTLWANSDSFPRPYVTHNEESRDPDHPRSR